MLTCTIFLVNNIRADFFSPDSCVLFIPHPGCEKIRLAGASRCSGRVEVFHDGRWGTVCDDLWSLANAKVVCRQLQCGAGLAGKGSAFFGEGQGNIWLDDVQCSGEETSILQCNHNPLGTNNCGHSEDAGVVCSGQSHSLPGLLSFNCTTQFTRPKKKNQKLYHRGWLILQYFSFFILHLTFVCFFFF